MNQKNFILSIDHLNRAMTKGVYLDEIHCERAHCYISLSKKKDKQKNLELAYSDANDAIIKNEDSSKLYKCYRKRAQVNFELKNLKESIQDYETSLGLIVNDEDIEAIRMEWKKSKKMLIKQNYSLVKMPRQSKLIQMSKDEEIKKILSNPFIRKSFKEITNNPETIKKYLKNEKFKLSTEKITKILE